MTTRLAKTAAVLLMGAGVFTLMAPVGATPPDPNHQVTICHRTNSVTNPYVVITVDEAAIDTDTGNDNGRGDHNAEHDGPTFDVTADPDVAYPPPHDGDQWGDIIPPFYENGDPGTWPAKNWDAAGQAIFEAGCAIPAPPTTTTSSTSTTSTTEEPTTTTSSSTTSTSTTSTSTTSTSTTSTSEPPTPGLFAFGAAGTECQAEVPFIVITFANTFPDLAGDVGTLFIEAASDGSDVGEVELAYEPGATIEILYPGAEVDDEGNIIDLPGWTLQDNGLWVIDESDAFLREGLVLTYVLGDETATAEVAYPPESSLCANPPENPPPTTPPTTPPTEPTTPTTDGNPPLSPPVAPPGQNPPPAGGSTPTLPRTGSDIGMQTTAGIALLLGGGTLLLTTSPKVRRGR